jgi:hypothetical protein
VTTQRGEDPATADQPWYAQPMPRTPADDAPSASAVPAVHAVVNGAGTAFAPPVGSTRAERRRAREASGDDTGPIERVLDGGSALLAPGPSAAGATRWTPEMSAGGRDAGPGPSERDSGFGAGRPESGPDTGPVTRVSDTGPVGRVSDTGPVGRVTDGSGELYGALRESADRREAGEGSAVQPRWHRRAVDEPAPVEEDVAFDPGDTGTWKVSGVVPGADGGRRNTTILRYLLGLLAVDHLRALTRWAFAVPVVGLGLLLIKPRWIGLAVLVLGLLLIVGRVVAVRMIERRTLPRRYRPVEDDLRAAVEAGKANLRGELRRVGMPSSALALTRSAVRSGSSGSRSDDRSRLRDIEIDRVLPRAQLDRALRVLDGATAGR